jgi:predicted metal-dependent peptidase
MSEQALERIKRSRAKMLVKHPFFASLMMSMRMVYTDEIPTAATDMKRLYINPAFVDGIDDDVLLFVIAHEIMHTALEHGMRRRDREPMLWNIAADFSINLTLKDCGFKIWDQALNDDKYRNDDKLPMAADYVYNLLKQERDKQPQPQQGQPGSGPPGMGEPGGQYYSPMLGDLKEPEDLGDPVSEDALRRDIQQRVAQAANVARMMGNLSAGLERFVQEVLDPKVPWQERLRHLMQRFTPDEENWARRNRRFNIYLPSRHSERMGEIVFIDDTSGSISNEEIKQYNGEQASVAESCNPESIRIVYCDAKVKGEQVFEDGAFDVSELEPKGGGGTDMRVALEYVEQYDPEIVVLLTDGFTPWPTDEPLFPLIICCTTETTVPAWADVVRI